jgi:hypothetical protein
MNEELSPIQEVLKSFADEVIRVARIDIEAKRTINGRRTNRVASGNLRDSLTYTMLETDKGTQLAFTVKDAKTAKYADVIDKGRRPNSKQPPTEAILQWMKIKGIKLRDENKKILKKQPVMKLKRVKVKFKGKRKLRSVKRATDSRWNAAAYNIARAIGKRGIPGINYMNNAIVPVWDEYDDAFASALNKMVSVRLTQSLEKEKGIWQ